jgi:hypothetical protein
VDIKAWKEVPVRIIAKSFSNCYLSIAKDGTQDDIIWDDSEQSGDGAPSSENESATEGSSRNFQIE